MTDEEEHHIYTESDFDIRVTPYQAVGYSNQFGWQLWNTYIDRSAGFGPPFKTEEEAYLDASKAVTKTVDEYNRPE